MLATPTTHTTYVGPGAAKCTTLSGSQVHGTGLTPARYNSLPTATHRYCEVVNPGRCGAGLPGLPGYRMAALFDHHANAVIVTVTHDANDGNGEGEGEGRGARTPGTSCQAGAAGGGCRTEVEATRTSSVGALRATVAAHLGQGSEANN